MDRTRVQTDKIQIGTECGSDICDQEGRILLGRGVAITEAILAHLVGRDVEHVFVDASDVGKLTGRSEPAPSSSAEPGANLADMQRSQRGVEPYSVERSERFAQQLAAATALINDISSDVKNISPATMEKLVSVPESIAGMLIEDSDQAISAAEMDNGTTSLPDRCAQMSMLAMSTGIEMDLPVSDILLLGTAGLLHDIGLFLLPPHFRDPATTLDDEESYLYQRHPEFTADLLSDSASISSVARLLILQVHELADGSGYPRGFREHRWHPLSRVLNTVEVYLALINPAPGRPAIVPHDAISFMLLRCRDRLFDTDVMRAFINQMSLFPVGSIVRLDAGEIATVVRRDVEYDQPVVVIDGDEDTTPFALLGSDRSIIGAAVRDKQRQMRLERGMLEVLTVNELIYSGFDS